MAHRYTQSAFSPDGTFIRWCECSAIVGTPQAEEPCPNPVIPTAYPHYFGCGSAQEGMIRNVERTGFGGNHKRLLVRISGMNAILMKINADTSTWDFLPIRKDRKLHHVELISDRGPHVQVQDPTMLEHGDFIQVHTN